MIQVAKNAGLSSERLFKALTKETGRSFDTILKVVSALGMKLSPTVRQEAEVALALLTIRRHATIACVEAPPSNIAMHLTRHRKIISPFVFLLLQLSAGR